MLLERARMKIIKYGGTYLMYSQRKLRDQCPGLSQKILPRYLMAFLIIYSYKRTDKIANIPAAMEETRLVEWDG